MYDGNRKRSGHPRRMTLEYWITHMTGLQPQHHRESQQHASVLASSVTPLSENEHLTNQVREVQARQLISSDEFVVIVHGCLF
jgi:hypothetical protein